MKDIFTNIIKNKRWPGTCGTGSFLENTEPLRNALPDFLNKYQIHSMFDAPCGNYSWMSLVKFSENFTYIGGDIVDSLIEQNQITWPNQKFLVFDLTQDPLPDVDLLFCRDCLIHLSNKDLIKVFDNILSSNVKYVMTTSYPDTFENIDIQTGQFQQLNLEKHPFCMPSPVDFIKDGPPHNRNMCLWNKDDFFIASKLFK
jgi:hypothetical protein